MDQRQPEEPLIDRITGEAVPFLVTGLLACAMPPAGIVIPLGYYGYRFGKAIKRARDRAREEYELQLRKQQEDYRDQLEEERQRAQREHQENMERIRGWAKIEAALAEKGVRASEQNISFEERLHRLQRECEARRRAAALLNDRLSREMAEKEVNKFWDDEIRKLFGKRQ